MRVARLPVLKGLRLLLLAGCWAGQEVLACTAPSVDVSLGQVESRWTERSAVSVLVTERGRLQQQGLGVSADCGLWRWELDLLRSAGSRRYEGQTNTGVLVQTRTEVEGHQLALKTWYSLTSEWSVGVQVDGRSTDRRLAGVGPVLGYAERYSQLGLAMGLQFVHDAGRWGAWQWRVWRGQDVSGDVRIDLPGMDRAVLPLGSSGQWGGQLRWTGCHEPERWSGWRCSLIMDYLSEQIAAGVVTPIYQRGVLSAAAHQPATSLRSTSIRAALSYRFH